MKPNSDLLDAWKLLDAAQKASDKASEARAALPTGATRAKVTTANARWGRAAEDRDRKVAAYRAALVAELRRLQPMGEPGRDAYYAFFRTLHPAAIAVEPTWDALPKQQRDAWNVAALAHGAKQ